MRQSLVYMIALKEAFEPVWQVLVHMIALKWGFWTCVTSAGLYDGVKRRLLNL